MTEKREYRRINCGIFLNPEEHKIVDNTMVFHPEFINRYNDYKAWFVETFEQLLTDTFGEDGWAVNFIQVTQHEPSFFADFYLDAGIEYHKIANTVSNILTVKQIRCTPFLRGTIADYIRS